MKKQRHVQVKTAGQSHRKQKQRNRGRKRLGRKRDIRSQRPGRGESRWKQGPQGYDKVQRIKDRDKETQKSRTECVSGGDGPARRVICPWVRVAH